MVTTTFGTNAITDAFWVAFRVPNFLRRLFAEGSFATAFVPVFTEVKETRSHAELRELMARTAGILQLLFQLPSLKGINLLTLPRWGWSHPGVRKVMT
ncbi:hypothetical protein G9O68_15350, partial [Listeria seeligeri]|nr:hypothetical protein [Listeria seeligeri]